MADQFTIDHDLQVAQDDARERGIDRGQSIASWMEAPEDPQTCSDWCGVCVDRAPNQEARTYEMQFCIMQSEANDAEANDRQFSPFEFSDDSEELWASYDLGLTVGIQRGIIGTIGNHPDA